MRMAFFAARPMSITKPICYVRLEILVCCRVIDTGFSGVIVLVNDDIGPARLSLRLTNFLSEC